MLIRVEQGKGGKDRYVMLLPQLFRWDDKMRGRRAVSFVSSSSLIDALPIVIASLTEPAPS
jgi:hypothetical protein